MDINKLGFKDFVLSEGISAGSIDKATFLMIKYLKKKTGLKLFAIHTGNIALDTALDTNDFSGDISF